MEMRFTPEQEQERRNKNIAKNISIEKLKEVKGKQSNSIEELEKRVEVLEELIKNLLNITE